MDVVCQIITISIRPQRVSNKQELCIWGGLVVQNYVIKWYTSQMYAAMFPYFYMHQLPQGPKLHVQVSSLRTRQKYVSTQTDNEKNW